MARIFNIYFTHDDVLHSAIVSVRNTPLLTEYILGNLDEELRKTLPSNVVTATDIELRCQNGTESHPHSLMNAITKSLAAHLCAGNNVAREL